MQVLINQSQFSTTQEICIFTTILFYLLKLLQQPHVHQGQLGVEQSVHILQLEQLEQMEQSLQLQDMLHLMEPLHSRLPQVLDMLLRLQAVVVGHLLGQHIQQEQ
jgi:hypothetical protein